MKEKGRDRRLRTGCLICKLRHVKCDEERPACKNCREANRQCMGYPPPSTTTVAGPSSGSSSKSGSASQADRQVIKAPISNRGQWSQKEIRSFSFGMNKTLPNLTTYFESEFWNKQLPRLAHHEPAVRHALSALATFHEKSHQHDAMIEGKGQAADIELIPGSLDKFFLQQYNKAISELTQKISGNGQQAVISTLVCCVIFMCIEGLHGRHLAMVNHIKNGLRVYHEWIRHMDPNSRFGPASIEATVYSHFKRIDFQAATFIDNHQPEPKILSVVQLPPLVDDFDPVFVSIEQARSHVDSLMGRIFMFLRFYDGMKFAHLEVEKIPQDIRDKHRAVSAWVQACAAALDQFLRDSSFDDSSISNRSMTLLRLRTKVLGIFLRRWPYERAQHEECELDFHSAFSLAKSLVMGSIRALLTPEDSDQGLSPHSDSSEGASTSSRASSSTSSSSSPSRFRDPPIFTFETAIVPILYYIAVSTISLDLRRDCISLLRTANLREGLWSSSRTADMAETRIAAHNGEPCPITGSEMSELTKVLWTELELEQSAEGWGIE